jgi:hypothetical protein
MISVMLRHGISLYLEGCKVPHSSGGKDESIVGYDTVKIGKYLPHFEKAHCLHLQGSL